MLRSRTWCLTGILVLVLGISGASAQFAGLAPNVLELDDLSAFDDPPANWSVADSAWADPDETHHLEPVAGSGVLVNQPTDAANGHLFTSWEHADLEIEMDVMMPRGSNSGIYLQGRYEIQLLDSWGVSSPTFGDMGGIYQRWRPNRPEGQRGIGGQAPRVNVAKAPGLWQHLKIDFRAPRFDENGEKIAPARFAKVTLNGVVVHRNVELTGPTRAAAFEDEVRRGPLMIQGDHGPVAIKNVRYKRYTPGAVELSGVQYEIYEGSWDEGLNLDTASVAERGSSPVLDGMALERDDDFAVVYEGSVTVPRDGSYAFDLVLDWIVGDPHFSGQEVGGGTLEVGGETVIDHEGDGRSAGGSVELEAGTRAFRLTYFKNRSGRPATGLFVEGPSLRRTELTAEESLPESAPSDPIYVEPSDRAKVIRSFFDHGDEKRTHVASVGHPSDYHYAYDLARGSLLRVWKGRFLQANPMWEGRGFTQRALPLGSGPVLSGQPLIARLTGGQAAWPDSVQRDLDHEYLGYARDEHGTPTFRYRAAGLEVHDRLRPDSTGGGLVRTLRIEGSPDASELFLRPHRSANLRSASSGRWVAGDRAYYVEMLQDGGAKWAVRTSEGARELLVPIRSEDLPLTIRYAIVW